jgi:crotonobetainyl-CoA:carnitine CoA-transferase CaiB-like acyl-CoA transferase
MNLPLEDMLVVDFSQFLSGPSASLRLADLGARVIKIEKPETGDICRSLYVSNTVLEGESTVFHAINRNKESFAADLKKPSDREKVLRLITKADVVMHNFRPGVMERLGFDYETVKSLNPKAIYASISGYGEQGPMRDKPGQDLLVQSLSGLTWLSGNCDDGPVPMGLAIVDILTGAHLAQGVLAALVRRGLTDQGAKIETNMLESICDFQFETITTWHRDGGVPPERTATNNAHAYLGAPYGVYQTADGYLALAMGSIPQLGQLLDCPELEVYADPASWFTQRDEIKSALAAHLKTKTNTHWLGILEPADIWCAAVLDWPTFMGSEAWHALDMVQEVERGNGFRHRTTACPITLDGQRPKHRKGSPTIGEQTAAISEEFSL